MRLQLRDSHLWHCQKRMVIDPLEEEGQAIVTHRCLHCMYAVRLPVQRPQKTTSPFMAELRKRAWPE